MGRSAMARAFARPLDNLLQFSNDQPQHKETTNIMLTPYDHWQRNREREQARARLDLDELTITGELPADSPFTLAGTLYYDPTTDELVVRNEDS